jgi:hypothetical protein
MIGSEEDRRMALKNAASSPGHRRATAAKKAAPAEAKSPNPAKKNAGVARAGNLPSSSTAVRKSATTETVAADKTATLRSPQAASQAESQDFTKVMSTLRRVQDKNRELDERISRLVAKLA